MHLANDASIVRFTSQSYDFLCDNNPASRSLPVRVSIRIFEIAACHPHQRRQEFSDRRTSSRHPRALSLPFVGLSLFRWKVNFNWVDIDRFNEKSCGISDRKKRQTKGTGCALHDYQEQGNTP